MTTGPDPARRHGRRGPAFATCEGGCTGYQDHQVGLPANRVTMGNRSFASARENAQRAADITLRRARSRHVAIKMQLVLLCGNRRAIASTGSLMSWMFCRSTVADVPVALALTNYGAAGYLERSGGRPNHRACERNLDQRSTAGTSGICSDTEDRAQ